MSSLPASTTSELLYRGQLLLVPFDMAAVVLAVVQMRRKKMMMMLLMTMPAIMLVSAMVV